MDGVYFMFDCRNPKLAITVVPARNPEGHLVATCKEVQCNGKCGLKVIVPLSHEGPAFCGPKGCRKSGSVPPAFVF